MDRVVQPLKKLAIEVRRVGYVIPVPSAGTELFPVSPLSELSEVWFKAILRKVALSRW